MSAYLSSARPVQVCGAAAGNRLVPARAPQLEPRGCLPGGRTEYTVASDPEVAPLDGQTFYGAGTDVVRLGGDETISIGGNRHGRPWKCGLPARYAAGIPVRSLLLGRIRSDGGDPWVDQCRGRV